MDMNFHSTGQSSVEFTSNVCAAPTGIRVDAGGKAVFNNDTEPVGHGGQLGQLGQLRNLDGMSKEVKVDFQFFFLLLFRGTLGRGFLLVLWRRWWRRGSGRCCRDHMV